MPHETPRTCSARANDDTNRLFTLMYKYTSGRVQRTGSSPPAAGTAPISANWSPPRGAANRRHRPAMPPATNPNLIRHVRPSAHNLPNELRPHRHPSHA
ncbi:hypothetical protein A6CPBBH3_21710 [Alistipes communis]|nr:hypothetical protein A6CPBBH3_21710 [Alistipes communis]